MLKKDKIIPCVSPPHSFKLKKNPHNPTYKIYWKGTISLSQSIITSPLDTCNPWLWISSHALHKHIRGTWLLRLNVWNHHANLWPPNTTSSLGNEVCHTSLIVPTTGATVATKANKAALAAYEINSLYIRLCFFITSHKQKFNPSHSHWDLLHMLC